MVGGGMTDCKFHDGIEREIDHLKLTDQSQWVKIGNIDERMNAIMSRLNITLGGVAVSCALLGLNLIVMLMKGG